MPGLLAGRSHRSPSSLLIGWTLALLVASAGAVRADVSLMLEPPALEKLKCVKTPLPAAMSRDWHAWDGGKTDVDPKDLIVIAKAYAEGTPSLDPDPEVAKRILTYLTTSQNDATAQARQELAKLTVAAGSAAAKAAISKDQVATSVKLLEQAVAAREVSAATALGQFYEQGLLTARDPAKALTYYRMAATAGDYNALLGVARLAKAGAIPDLKPAQVDEAVRVAVVGLLADIGNGDCGSMFVMGMLYNTGDILPLNPTLAAHWFEATAHSTGHAGAAEHLAHMYKNGVGVEMSLPKMFEFLGIAARGGKAGSMLLLGQSYALGDGTKPDRDKAITWFEKAVKGGKLNGLRWLAKAWRGDFGGTPDLPKAFTYLKRDAERPDADRKTFFELGDAYLNGKGTSKDVAAAITVLDKAASLGVKDAAETLGDVYRDGLGIPADPLRAARYYRIAASFGNVGAMIAMSELHQCGRGVAWSPELAQKWRERAAFARSGSSLNDYLMVLPPAASSEEQSRRFRLLLRASSLGSREASVRISAAYERGLGIAPDAKLAETWRQRALAPGDDAYRGYIALATAYENGTGFPKNLDKARDLLQESADAGEAKSEYELARFLEEHGGGGANEARTEMVAAASDGDPTAMRTLSRELPVGANAGGKDKQGWLHAAADAGDTRAKIAIARQDGDPAAIERHLDDIVRGGVCESDQMADIAIAYFAVGNNGAHSKGMTWLERAERMGSADHQVIFTLGQSLASGIGGPELKAKGLALLTDVANAGMVKAMRQLATGYQSGLFGTPDAALAMQWLERAAAAGDANSAMDFAKFAATSGKPAELDRAHAYLVKAAATSASAARELGQLSLRGLFGPAAQAEAVAWLTKAAQSGDIAAMRDLADLLATGAGGLARDPAQSIDWLRKAAVGGDARAMFKLAAAYEAGFGTASDAALADQWYAKARKAGVETP